MTVDARIEVAAELKRVYEERVANKGPRGAEKYAVSRLANAFGLSERTIRDAVSWHAKLNEEEQAN